MKYAKQNPKNPSVKKGIWNTPECWPQTKEYLHRREMSTFFAYIQSWRYFRPSLLRVGMLDFFAWFRWWRLLINQHQQQQLGLQKFAAVHPLCREGAAVQYDMACGTGRPSHYKSLYLQPPTSALARQGRTSCWVDSLSLRPLLCLTPRVHFHILN